MSTSEEQKKNEIYEKYMYEAEAYALNLLKDQPQYSAIDFYEKFIQWAEREKSSEARNQEQLEKVIKISRGFIEAHKILIDARGPHLKL